MPEMLVAAGVDAAMEEDLRWVVEDILRFIAVNHVTLLNPASYVVNVTATSPL